MLTGRREMLGFAKKKEINSDLIEPRTAGLQSSCVLAIVSWRFGLDSGIEEAIFQGN